MNHIFMISRLAGSRQSFQKGTNDKKRWPPIPVILTEALWSGEISPSDGTGGITVGDLSTQSIMGAFSICPIPTRSPARDDGVGEQHTVISTEAGQPPIGKPLIVQARGQLRLTWRLYAESPQSGKISPSNGMGGITSGDLSAQSIMGAVPIYPPYRHAAPLEMTVVASAPLVISTEAERSGEISRLNSPGSMEAGNLRTQSPPRAPHTGPFPARDDQGQPLTVMEPE